MVASAERPAGGSAVTDRRHTVVDVDAHFLDTSKDLAAYMPEEEPWTERFEEARMDMLPNPTPDLYRGGRIRRDDVGYPVDHDDVVAIQDHVGFDKIVMIPMAALLIASIQADDRRPELLAQGFVDLMLDRIVDPDAGIYSVIPAPSTDPGAAAELIDEYGQEDGIIAACLGAEGAEPPLGHHRYDVIYDAATSADLPVIVHGGGSGLDSFHRKGYANWIESHSIGFVQTNIEQLTSMVMQGVTEKFPDLDVVFEESGVLWVGSYMYRLDQEYLKRQDEAPLLDALPSDYVRDSYYFGTQPLERNEDPEYFRKAMETVGIDRFMYASDFPHWDYDPPSAVDDLGIFSEAEKEMLLGGTAEEVFDV